MKVRLNLATAPFENNRRFLLTVTVAGLISVISLVVLSATAVSNWRANRTLREEVGRLEAEMREYQRQRRELEDFFKQPSTRQQMDRAAFLNSLIEQRSFPWSQIFTALERWLPEGVHVVSLAPRMQDGRVHLKLVFGAATDEAKLEFLRTLEKGREFSQVQVVAENRPKASESPDKVIVELAAVYVAPGEAPPQAKEAISAQAAEGRE
jgi:Tfp pilus assembly protein PilN